MLRLRFIYLVMFRTIESGFLKISEDGWAFWKALLVMTVLTGWLMLSIGLLVDIKFNSADGNWREIGEVVAFIAIVSNGLLVRRDKHRAEMFRRYESFSLSSKRRATVASLLFALLVVALVLLMLLAVKLSTTVMPEFR